MELIKESRESRGLTQKQLGAKVGCSAQQIYNFETGRSPVPMKYIKKMADTLKIPQRKMLTEILNFRNMKFVKGAK